MNIRRLECCGIIELSGLGTYSDWLKALQDSTFNSKGGLYDNCRIHLRCGWVLFSEAHGGEYGKNFADWLEKEQLGTVQRLPEVINRNTAHRIRVYLWAVDHDAYGKWIEANRLTVVVTEPIGQTINLRDIFTNSYMPPQPAPTYTVTVTETATST